MPEEHRIAGRSTAEGPDDDRRTLRYRLPRVSGVPDGVPLLGGPALIDLTVTPPQVCPDAAEHPEDLARPPTDLGGLLEVETFALSDEGAVPRYPASRLATGRAVPAATVLAHRLWGRRGLDMDEAQLAAPVIALFSALELRDRNLVASLLSPGVRLDVPSLGFACTGRNETLDAIGAVLVAFPDFRYRVRSRYVAPDQVTDEAVLEGTWTGPLLDGPPNGAAGAVPARLILAHDGDVVTAVTFWADAGALCELVDLPETLPTLASPLVSRLRATLPAAEGRVILAQERDSTIAERKPAAPPPPVAQPPRLRAPRGGELKVPVPHKVRRLQAAVLALLMVMASFALVAWVVSGTIRTAADQPPPLAGTTPQPSPGPARETTIAVVAGPDAPIEVKFDEARNEFELSSDALFFDTGSAKLTPQAQTALTKVVTQLRKERRYGRITVNGYTDQRGASAYNKRLSQARADAVAAALRKALGNLVRRVTVNAVGHGEQGLIVPTGTTSEELAPNRRVTIQVPKAGS